MLQAQTLHLSVHLHGGLGLWVSMPLGHADGLGLWASMPPGHADGLGLWVSMQMVFS